MISVLSTYRYPPSLITSKDWIPTGNLLSFISTIFRDLWFTIANLRLFSQIAIIFSLFLDNSFKVSRFQVRAMPQKFTEARPKGQEAHISSNALKIKQPTAARPKRAEALSPGQRPKRAEALSPGQRPGYKAISDAP